MERKKVNTEEVRKDDERKVNELYLYELFEGKQKGSHCALVRRGIISDDENKEENK
jgi:hypothetical protein